MGVDVGVGAMAVCSDGTTVTNPQALASGIKRLRRLDKAIARSLNVHGKSNHFNRMEQAVRQAAQPLRPSGQCTE